MYFGYLASKYFAKDIIEDPFIVSRGNQMSAHKHSTLIPSSKIFNLPRAVGLKFYLFKFHDIFDGLLGVDNLEILRSNLDFGNGYLCTPNAKIKLLFQNTMRNLNQITVEPRCEQVIQIKTTNKNGEIIIPYQRIGNCEIPESLSIAKNGLAITTILNSSTEKELLDFSIPIKVERFNRKEIESIDFNLIDDRMEYHNIDIANSIRTDHMNDEERNAILKLCKEYSDIILC